MSWTLRVLLMTWRACCSTRNVVWRGIPLLDEEGWMRLKKISRSLLSAADGVAQPQAR